MSICYKCGDRLIVGMVHRCRTYLTASGRAVTLNAMQNTDTVTLPLLTAQEALRLLRQYSVSGSFGSFGADVRSTISELAKCVDVTRAGE